MLLRASDLDGLFGISYAVGMGTAERPSRRNRRRWEYFKIDLKEIACAVVE
jgi:hypothetical protein